MFPLRYSNLQGRCVSPVNYFRGSRQRQLICYSAGSVLATHVDRLPLVSSAIINVASDVDEPWPLEVIGHNGKATNVTMEPGDMVLYESHSVLHGVSDIDGSGFLSLHCAALLLICTAFCSVLSHSKV